MTLKMTLAAALFISALATSEARAGPFDCTLEVSPSSPIERGQSFSYKINIPLRVYPSPQPPGYPDNLRYTVVFYGPDISTGETYPGTFGYGSSELTGYQNPSSGQYSGTYYRYAKIYTYPGGGLQCTTNAIVVELK